MGRKQQSYWTVRLQVSEFEFTHVMFNWITWPSCVDQRQYGVFPSAGHLYRAYLRCHGFLNSSPISQFHRPQLTNQNAMWPNWPTFHQLDQLPTNFSPTWPAPGQIHQLFTNFTNFSPSFHQLFTNFSPTFHQLFTNFSPTFHQLHQPFTTFTKLTNFSLTSPTFHQLPQLFTNFTNLTRPRSNSPTSPIFANFTQTFHRFH